MSLSMDDDPFEDVNTGPSFLGPSYNWKSLVLAANSEAMLKVLNPTNLGRAPRPSLTLDGQGNVVVFTGLDACGALSTIVFCPLIKDEKSIDPHAVSAQLAALGDQAEGTVCFP